MLQYPTRSPAQKSQQRGCPRSGRSNATEVASHVLRQLVGQGPEGAPSIRSAPMRSSSLTRSRTAFHRGASVVDLVGLVRNPSRYLHEGAALEQLLQTSQLTRGAVVYRGNRALRDGSIDVLAVVRFLEKLETQEFSANGSTTGMGFVFTVNPHWLAS